MSTPQDSPKRKKQKARRTKQLMEWRIKNASQTESGGGAKAAPKKTAAKKTAAKKTDAKK